MGIKLGKLKKGFLSKTRGNSKKGSKKGSRCLTMLGIKKPYITPFLTKKIIFAQIGKKPLFW